jgi:hypothetical protein
MTSDRALQIFSGATPAHRRDRFKGKEKRCVPSAGWRIREIPDCASSPKTHSFPSRSGGSPKAHVQLFGAALGLELLRWFFDDAVAWRR